MRSKCWLALLAAMLLVCPDLRAVELVLDEVCGLERIGEPVTCGVPLARGWCRSERELVLLDEQGRPIPVEIRAVSHWPDGSLQWVHLDFQADLPARTYQKLHLEQAEPPAVDSRLQVRESPEAVTVSTGRITASVLRGGFNVFERVSLAGGAELVPSHDRGLVAWSGGVEYRSSLDRASTVTVESRGPLRVVLRAEGDLVSADGRALLHHVCRLYFYHDSPIVRLAWTIENRDPVIERALLLEGLQLELPTPLARAGNRYHLGRDAENLSGPLTAGGSAWARAFSSDRYEFGGAAEGQAPGSDPRRDLPYRLGWGGVGGPQGALGLAVRHFWQMHPSRLEVSAAEGLLRAELYPRSFAKPLPLQAGVARTHYLQFGFTEQDDPERLAALTATVQRPLFAAAGREYYCVESGAFGKLYPRGPAPFPAEYRRLASRVDYQLERGYLNMQDMIYSRTVRGVTRDSYGFMNWGDGLHYAWQEGVDDDRNLSWNHHYYDLPHMACLEYARGGCLCMLEFFLSRAHHLMDIHYCHFGPDSPLTGHNRYCPSTDHVRLDPTDPGDFTTARVYVHPNLNHSKVQGLFDRWRLIGDERAREVALEGLALADSFGAYGDFAQPRGAAHQVLTLVDGYRMTGDRKYLETAGKTFQRWYDHSRDGRPLFTDCYFQVGLLLEAFVDYHEATGDKRVIEFVQTAVDWMRSQRPEEVDPNMSLGIGFLWGELREPRYRELLAQHLEQWQGVYSNPFKDYALHGRNVARALYYLSLPPAGAGR